MKRLAVYYDEAIHYFAVRGRCNPATIDFIAPDSLRYTLFGESMWHWGMRIDSIGALKLAPVEICRFQGELLWQSAGDVKVTASTLSPSTSAIETKMPAEECAPKKAPLSAKTVKAVVGLIASSMILLGACASGSAISPRCIETPCGDICCNGDGKICPACYGESHNEAK